MERFQIRKGVINKIFPKKDGFTLIELLVVITVILILAGISLPLIEKVKERARAAVCSNNLKQLGMGLIMYMEDWDGCLNLSYEDLYDFSDNDYQYFWPHLLYPKYIKTKETFGCPSIIIRQDLQPNNYRTYLMPSTICNGPKGKKLMSYREQDKIVLLTDANTITSMEPFKSFTYYPGVGLYPSWGYGSISAWLTTGRVNWLDGKIIDSGVHGSSGLASDPSNFWYCVFLDGHCDIVKATDFTAITVHDGKDVKDYSNPNGKAIIYYEHYR
jgi:prepilin-type N-terminal cleavage/methylation domain-containing protein